MGGGRGIPTLTLIWAIAERGTRTAIAKRIVRRTSLFILSLQKSPTVTFSEWQTVQGMRRGQISAESLLGVRSNNLSAKARKGKRFGRSKSTARVGGGFAYPFFSEGSKAGNGRRKRRGMRTFFDNIHPWRGMGSLVFPKPRPSRQSLQKPERKAAEQDVFFGMNSPWHRRCSQHAA